MFIYFVYFIANQVFYDRTPTSPATPAFVGEAHELEWKNKWLKDEWGRWIVQETEMAAIVDPDGNVNIPVQYELQKVLNPAYDPTRNYIPRSKRHEWSPVGLLGSSSYAMMALFACTTIRLP
ncbi:hypothetical protein GXP70_15595 [Paenibacillus lycopersici]|uniref:Peptidase G2 IMC autoproteolytic cleavage domain-containing protein n=1 Tax=Paenibacillus lycopersici TaxID=2704462 RepID=A0A6C0G1Y8_9BACL|nr:peptidase G2 autoproteolytic cleavage domain-containing protein [Paenibacillus lycopersici]QHT61239.1 hypothetical protein GXP70_15595 [Paenibacillus lycopersici]